MIYKFLKLLIIYTSHEIEKIHSKRTIPLPTNVTGVVRGQDNIVRARLHADEGGGQAAGLEAQLRRHRAHVEGRLHYQKVVERIVYITSRVRAGQAKSVFFLS